MHIAIEKVDCISKNNIKLLINIFLKKIKKNLKKKIKLLK